MNEASVAAAVLDTGRVLDRLSRPLTVLALGGLLFPGLGGVRWALAAVAVAGVAQLVLAARVSLDAALFRGLAGEMDLAGLDRGLLALGLLPPGKAGRPLAPRLAGARRLLLQQATCLLAQVAACLGAALA